MISRHQHFLLETQQNKIEIHKDRNLIPDILQIQHIIWLFNLIIPAKHSLSIPRGGRKMDLPGCIWKCLSTESQVHISMHHFFQHINRGNFLSMVQIPFSFSFSDVKPNIPSSSIAIFPQGTALNLEFGFILTPTQHIQEAPQLITFSIAHTFYQCKLGFNYSQIRDSFDPPS